MDIRQLVYFVKVVEMGSFSEAARGLNVAQTALGFHVRNLEQEFQTKLLVRHSRGVKPTEAGLRLLDHARRIIELADRTRQHVTDAEGPIRGRIVLGMPSSVIVMLAVPLLRRCQRDYPEVTLTLIEDRSNVLLEWVQSERLEMALVFDDQAVTGVTSESLLSEDLFFVRRSGGDVGGGPISFAEVLDHPLVSFSGVLRRILEEHAAAIGRDANVLFDVRSVLTGSQLAEEGVAATIIPYPAVRRQVEDGRVVARRVVDPVLTRTLWLVSPLRRPMTRAEVAIRAILHTLLVEAAEELPDVWRLHVSPQKNS